ncbi:DUF6314 family protein [Defluviimonas sp. D31]|uniref:DUF6314 family protein n=1 Tax=Defluviimonas sp. D31 TaxID=3083253 RepID=UPI00296F0F70|nr:DUF6314 family protein [Defluviimonas sp. D31]MDW4548470.1 DUF6314 family protein [Defluviimonas sp. D31]
MSFIPKLTDFTGEWQVGRVIQDRLGHAEGRFEGRAFFRPVEIGLAYHEEGELRLGPGPSMTAVRDYLWRIDGERIAVDHGDGKPFHAFDPAFPEAHHLCSPDDYRVHYDFCDWPDWRAVWVVMGPRKDYTMISRYSRV